MEKSSSQLTDPEVRDIGWHRPAEQLPAPIVHRLSNDDLFTLIRRFNKIVYHVKAIPRPPRGHLDFEISSCEEFTPDKLRAYLERFYIIVIIGMAAFGKHIARLRSWNEPRRTAYFCAAYYIAWCLNLLFALFISVLLGLIVYPPLREKLFPPAPLAAVSASSGNLQVPRAGTLGSADSLSGAPEAHPGEAVEQEAANFVAGLASISAGTAAGQGTPPKAPGKDDDAEPETDPEVEGVREAGKNVDKDVSGLGKAMPDPTNIASAATRARGVADGGRADGAHDATREPVQSAMWAHTGTVMHMLAEISDTWERIGNALSPTPPFSHIPRLRFAALLVPALFASVLVPAQVAMKAGTFSFGFAFFAQPLIVRGAHWLTRRFPNWRQALDARRTLLKGVPTNAQLAVTLLRVAERNKMPLPPPPSPHGVTDTDKKGADAVSSHDYAFDSSNYEIEGVDEAEHEKMENMHAQQGEETDPEDGEKDSGKKKKHSAGSKIASLLKRTTKVSIEGGLGIDHLKAKVGSEAAKRRLGAVSPPPERVDAPDAHGAKEADRAGDVGEGPTAFSARFRGRRGRVLLVTSAASPCVAFVLDRDLDAGLVDALGPRDTGEAVKEKMRPAFAVPLGDVVGVRKIGGFGWKGRLVVGWALGRPIVDGLEIEERSGKQWVVTAITGREELFARLVAVGTQYWECV
ncbi:hypothetical protein OBBRIDRAFT_730626 [Obba rivulosa]|uniref:Uncharacterized protein n=1 Tax=Obba rivulosa TaxID=1052685 RepID=A0A8E2DKY9_9APHY|nr:hypothetical protein OBBRIDRAFT_730626 [Obba rivulosa]